jgi:hypothetical protein
MSRRGTCGIVIAAALLLLPALTPAQQTPLASGELRIQGVELVVSSTHQTVPKNRANHGAG